MYRKINIGFVVRICTVASLGGLMFGFDIAIITGANPFVEQFFGLTKIELGLGTSSLLFGCIFGSFVAGRMADTYGRKTVLYFMALLFALTSVGTAISPTFWFYVVVRFLAGLAVGAASMASPMYISEVAPSHMRGKMVSFYQLSIVLGILISYLINYLLSNAGEDNWRWMFATGVVPSIILTFTLFFVPETPRYLTKKGKEEEAFAVLKKINGEEEATNELQQIKHSLQETKTYVKDLLKPEYRRFMFVGIGLAILVHQKMSMKKKQPDMQPCPAGRACTSKQMIASKIAIFEKQKTQSFIMKRASLVLN
jgi:SP family arabinose:H+ symporter-like MFS transporter